MDMMWIDVLVLALSKKEGKMTETQFTDRKKHPFYQEFVRYQICQRLMAAIFSKRLEEQFPICYPYILEDGEEISLEEGMQRAFDNLPDFPGRNGKVHWTKANLIRLLNLRFGLEDGKKRTQIEIGREFQVTKERIRQVEVKTLWILRRQWKILEPFLILTPEERTKEIQRLKRLATAEETEKRAATITQVIKEVRKAFKINTPIADILKRHGIQPQKLVPYD
ncbi:hypothetical protein IH779_03485 [Patescibacteria group bacterium]|nr:hypothetical protein [Patescibacteria group bacterium]